MDERNWKILEKFGVTPDNLDISGYLYLRDTGITDLPSGLEVGGYLDLRGTRITELPSGLDVGGSTYQ